MNHSPSACFLSTAKKRSRYSFTGWKPNWIPDGAVATRGGVVPTLILYNTDNILTGGYSYRWIGFQSGDGLLNLTLNNQSFAHPIQWMLAVNAGPLA